MKGAKLSSLAPSAYRWRVLVDGNPAASAQSYDLAHDYAAFIVAAAGEFGDHVSVAVVDTMAAVEARAA